MSSLTLATIQTQLTVYAYSSLMILGNIGNAFVIIFFHRKLQNACSMYLSISALMNIVYLTMFGFVQIFPFDYSDGTTRAIIVCKFYIYILNVLGQAPKGLLAFACIDRFLITNDRASFRAFSTPKKAKYLICFSIIFWFLISIHIPIMVTIAGGRCIKIGAYSIFYSIYSPMILVLIPSTTLGVFGYLSFLHLRKIGRRIQPTGNDGNDANNFIRRRDRDLLVLVISEVIVYVVTTALYPAIVIEMVISQYIIPNKSVLYLQTEIFTLNIAGLLLFINSAAPFYTYYIASKSFRRDFEQLIINIYQKLRRQTPVQVVPRTNYTLPQRDTRV